MREDSRVDIFLIAVTILTSVATLRVAFWRGADNPSWELRWRGLDPGYRDWLAAMTTSLAWRATLTDPEEIALANGFSRRERRRRSYLDLAATALLVVGVAATLAGLLPLSVCTFGLAIYAMVRWAMEAARDRQIRNKVPGANDPDTAPVR